MERSAWARMPVAALLLASVDAQPCAAQPPVPPSTMPPAVNPLASPGDGQLPTPPRPMLSPTVRPEVGQGRRELPPALPMPLGIPSPRSSEEGIPTSPLATGMQIKPAPYEPTDFRFPITFAAALRLSDARPMIVALAQSSVWVAEAYLTRAKLLWIPTLNIGFDYLRHDGDGPDFNKGIMTAPSVNFFYGGAGMWGVISATDAIFQPLVARQVLNSAHWDIQTAKNDALFQTAMSYFSVHQYRGMYARDLYRVERGHDLVQRITSLSRELVPTVEVDRARNLLAELEQQVVYARQEWRVTSANLTQLLRLDPRAVVEPLEHDHTQITLLDPAKRLDEMMPFAPANRPEIASRRALVQAAEWKIVDC